MRHMIFAHTGRRALRAPAAGMRCGAAARRLLAAAIGQLRDLGQSGWSIVPIIGVALGAWYVLPATLLLAATLSGCATASPQKVSVMWLPQSDYAATCALLPGATMTPEGCVTRSKTGCTIVTPAKQVSYDLFGGQMKECLR
jgi:hypothetical protein